MVDLWEAGEVEPTREQMEALSQLTGMTVEFFYTPVRPSETLGAMWICDRSRRKNGCRRVVPDEPVRAPLGRDAHEAGRLF